MPFAVEPEAWRAWLRYDAAVFALVRAGRTPERLDPTYGRLPTAAIRLALTLAAAEWALDGGPASGLAPLVERRHWAAAQEIAERWRHHAHARARPRPARGGGRRRRHRRRPPGALPGQGRGPPQAGRPAAGAEPLRRRPGRRGRCRRRPAARPVGAGRDIRACARASSSASVGTPSTWTQVRPTCAGSWSGCGPRRRRSASRRRSAAGALCPLPPTPLRRCGRTAPGKTRSGCSGGGLRPRRPRVRHASGHRPLSGFGHPGVQARPAPGRPPRVNPLP